jgi:lipoprotein NlpI/transglutaminase-like putative cysteine protease
MFVRSAARATLWLVLCLFAALPNANAQTPSSNPPSPSPSSPNLQEVQVANGAFSLGDPIPSWAETVAIPQADTSKPVVLRLSDMQWRIGDTPVLYVRRAITVNDVASLNAVGQQSIQFVPQYQRLQLHAIHVLRGDKSEDRTSSSTIRFLQRETGLEHGVYSGVVTASILVNDVRVGDTIELSYSLIGQNPVFGGKFVGTAFWDQGYPTSLRRVALTFPAARKINWRLIDDTRFHALTPNDSTRDGMRKLQFEERSIPETALDRLAPTDYASFRVLQFSEFSDWGQVASWANELFQANGAVTDEIRSAAAKLRQLPGNEERVAAALEFVQSEIRYFSVALGESSHRPTPPNIVLERRYGDCKDKSLLLITLLKELGIQSEPVLLDVVRRQDLGRFLPSPLLFDHVIVRATVDGKVFYLDPTRLGQHGRLERMGQSHEGAQVLVIAPGTRQLSTIVSPNTADLIRSERTETATLPKLSPEGTLQIHQTWNGVGAETFRVAHEHWTRAQFDKIVGDDMEARYPGTKLAGEPSFEDDRVNNVVSIAATYNVPNLAAEKDGNWIIRYNPVNLRGALPPAPSATRAAPLAVRGFPFEAHYVFEAKLPEEVGGLSDPRASTIEDKEFSYTVTTSFRGNGYKSVIDLKTSSDRVAVADLQKYGDDLREVDNTTKLFVLVTKDLIKSSTATDSDAFAQRTRDRLKNLIERITKAIDDKKLTGTDLANAYCARSGLSMEMGKKDEAFRDIGEAFKLDPDSPHLLVCRAGAYYSAGEFDKSVADYSKAVSLGETSPEVFRDRGFAEFFAGKLDKAADDFAKSSAAADKETAAYVNLWLVWTLQRLGRPVPEPLAKQAAAEARGDWPRSALAMLAGDISPDEMLAGLNSKTGDDLRMALAEAYFYVGEHYLVLNDRDQARAFFAKTRYLGVINFTEHIAAGFELGRLVEAAKN